MTDEQHLTVDVLCRLAQPLALSSEHAAPTLFVSSEAPGEDVVAGLRECLSTSGVPTSVRLVVDEQEVGYVKPDDLWFARGELFGVDYRIVNANAMVLGTGDGLIVPGHTDYPPFPVRCPHSECSYSVHVGYLDDTVTCPRHPDCALVEA